MVNIVVVACKRLSKSPFYFSTLNISERGHYNLVTKAKKKKQLPLNIALRPEKLAYYSVVFLLLLGQRLPNVTRYSQGGQLNTKIPKNLVLSAILLQELFFALNKSFVLYMNSRFLRNID